jgi:hypothetical protein
MATVQMGFSPGEIRIEGNGKGDGNWSLFLCSAKCFLKGSYPFHLKIIFNKRENNNIFEE